MLKNLKIYQLVEDEKLVTFFWKSNRSGGVLCKDKIGILTFGYYLVFLVTIVDVPRQKIYFNQRTLRETIRLNYYRFWTADIFDEFDSVLRYNSFFNALMRLFWQLPPLYPPPDQ